MIGAIVLTLNYNIDLKNKYIICKIIKIYIIVFRWKNQSKIKMRSFDKNIWKKK